MVILVLVDFGLGCARFVLRFGFVADLGCLCDSVGCLCGGVGITVRFLRLRVFCGVGII